MTTKFTRTFPRTFDGSGTDKKTEAGGSHFRLLETTAVLTVNVYRDGEQIANHVGVQQGFAWESIGDDGLPLYFDYLELTSAAAQTIKLTVGAGRAYNDATSGNVTATLVKPTTLSDTADVALAAAATTLILAASATRRTATITNLASNTKTFRIGAATAGAGRGAPLAPGASIEIEGTAAVYGYNPAGAIESVAVLTVSD